MIFSLKDAAVFFSMKKSFSIPFEHIILPITAKPEAVQRVFLGFHFGIRIPGIYNSGN